MPLLASTVAPPPPLVLSGHAASLSQVALRYRQLEFQRAGCAAMIFGLRISAHAQLPRAPRGFRGLRASRLLAPEDKHAGFPY